MCPEDLTGRFPNQKKEEMLHALKNLDIAQKIVEIAKVMEQSYSCQGFEIEEDEELYSVPLKRYKINDEDELVSIILVLIFLSEFLRKF